MKKLLFLLLTTVFCSGVQGTKYVVIQKSDGSRVTFQFSESPKLKHQNDVITLTTISSEIQYQTQNVAKVFIEDSEHSGVYSALTAEQGKMEIIGDAVLLHGFMPSEGVEILSVDGKILKSLKVQDNGELSIPLSAFPKGIIIIKSKHQSIKVIKK